MPVDSPDFGVKALDDKMVEITGIRRPISSSC